MAKVWTVKYKSFNRTDYAETVGGKNEKEAFKNAKSTLYRHDDRDLIKSVIEDKSPRSNWIT